MMLEILDCDRKVIDKIEIDIKISYKRSNPSIGFSEYGISHDRGKRQK